jgi:hypothetical protein
MSKKLMIVAEAVQMEAELNDSKTAALIWEALPISAAATTWGDEISWKKVAAGDTRSGLRQ